ncbi:hypothetical protein RBH89_24140 [Paracidovorax avenae]
MFDDYDYKSSAIFQITFRQRGEDRLHPWEIAGFFNQFNTIYYKNELLNSISSAVLRGIDPRDIIITDGSLPLNRRYSQLDLISEFEAAKYFYPIGLPFSLCPSEKTEKTRCLYEIFYTINSLLHSRKFRPLGIAILVEGLKRQDAIGEKGAEDYLVGCAIDFSNIFHEKYSRNYSDRTPLDNEDIEGRLSKIRVKQQARLALVSEAESLDPRSVERILDSGKRQDRLLQKELNAFFDIFGKIARPVVYVRGGRKQIRVLSRALVNKTVSGGLELKHASKNSPFLAVFQGIATLWQTQVEVRNKKELHEMEMLIKQQQLREATAKASVEEEKLRQIKISLPSEVIDDVMSSDIFDCQRLPDSHIKKRLQRAYASNGESARSIYSDQKMEVVKGSIKTVDLKA